LLYYTVDGKLQNRIKQKPYWRYDFAWYNSMLA